jgi:cell division protein FtsN
MPRDYVKSHSRRPQKHSGPSGVIWLLMGILIGLIIAGVFYVKNQNHPKPLILPEFSQKTPASSTSHNSPAPSHSPSSSTTPAKTVSPQNLQTQFDFYNVLPSQKVIGPSGDEDTADINPDKSQTPSSSSPAALPAEKQTKPDTPILPQQKKLPPVVQAVPSPKSKAVMTPAPLTAEKPSSYIVQVAALSNSGDADQLKAQLTLLGFEVKVTTLDKNGKTYHRVWLGPFHGTHEAESIQKQLQENMISSKVLKSGT